MGWKIDEQTLSDLEHDFSRHWHEQGGPAIPAPLSSALAGRLSKGFKAALVHPIGPPGHVTFLIIDEEERAVRVEYHAGSETTDIAFLGSLVGGQYVESVRLTEKGDETEGVFSHERSGELRITLGPPPPVGGNLGEEDSRARDRTVQLLAQFRKWATAPALSGRFGRRV